MIRRHRRSEDMRLDTVFNQDARFKGELISKSNVIIKGRVEGTMSVDGGLFIAPSALIKGNVLAKVAIVAGELQGNLRAEKLELRTTGRIQGDVMTPSAALAYGSLLRGGIKSGGELPSRILHFQEKRNSPSSFPSGINQKS